MKIFKIFFICLLLISQTACAQTKKTVNIVEQNCNCDKLIKEYTTIFDANKNDIDTVRKIVYLLSINECRDSQLFADVAEAMYKLMPDNDCFPISPFFRMNEKQIQQYEIDTNREADTLKRAKNLLLLSKYYYNEKKDLKKAFMLARQTIETNHNLGEPYMIIANCYLRIIPRNNNCEFGGRELYWLAADMYEKAKSVDSKLTNEADLCIKTCERYFPSKKNILDLSYKIGQKYIVDCNDIKAETTIRIEN